MTWADYTILAVIGISALLSLFRGYIREMLSLLAWAAAFWVGFTFSHRLAVLLEPHIPIPSARQAVAFLALFLLTLLVGGVVNYVAGQLVEKTGLSGTDRMLGVVFGALRGVAIVCVLVLLAGLTPLPHDPWWHESQLLGHFVKLALIARDFLPAEIGDNIAFD